MQRLDELLRVRRGLRETRFGSNRRLAHRAAAAAAREIARRRVGAADAFLAELSAQLICVWRLDNESVSSEWNYSHSAEEPQAKADCAAGARALTSHRRRARGSARICADGARRSRNTSTRAPRTTTSPPATRSVSRTWKTASRSRPARGCGAAAAARRPAGRSRTAARSVSDASTRVNSDPLQRTRTRGAAILAAGVYAECNT